jgi:hypothetical protein
LEARIGRKQAVQSFKSRFWSQVKADAAADRIVQKIYGNSLHSRSINHVVNLLAIVTNPESDRILKKLAPKMTCHFVPSQKALTGLAGRMVTLGKDVERNFLMPGFRRPETDHFLEFAKECVAHAEEIATIRLAPFTKRFTYKAFWKRVPAAMLCKVLDVPRFLSFGEIEKLVRCADQARGQKQHRASRNIEMQYKGFIKSWMNLGIPGQAVIDEFLHACLKILEAAPRN